MRQSKNEVDLDKINNYCDKPKTAQKQVKCKKKTTNKSKTPFQHYVGIFFALLEIYRAFGKC